MTSRSWRRRPSGSGLDTPLRGYSTSKALGLDTPLRGYSTSETG